MERMNCGKCEVEMDGPFDWKWFKGIYACPECECVVWMRWTDDTE